MPLISQFYGILIYLYAEQNSNHHKPHIHAIYAGHELAIAFNGEILGGADSFPKKQRTLVEAWVSLHEDELNAAWQAWIEDGEKIRIKGLE